MVVPAPSSPTLTFRTEQSVVADHLWRSFSLWTEQPTLAPPPVGLRCSSRLLPTSTSRVCTTVSIWPILGTVATLSPQRRSVFRALALTFSCT